MCVAIFAKLTHPIIIQQKVCFEIYANKVELTGTYVLVRLTFHDHLIDISSYLYLLLHDKVGRKTLRN